MDKQVIEGAGRFSYQYPLSAVIVTSHSGGKDNAMAVAWHSPLSTKPPLYGIAITSSRATYEYILEGKEFAINFLPMEKAELIAAVGGSKGKEIEKFEKFNIARKKAVKTSVALLQDAYAAYECTLVDHKTYGDHEWVVGDIVATHILEEAFTSKGLLDVARFSPALYLGGDIYLTTLKDTMKHLDRHEYGGR
jgi:flavin reductase (DIM6/NTAB) family NADH-FMN oxidoreductase RutF